MKKVGFIGLGTMGKPMAENLIKAGHSLTVFDINRDAVNDLEARGAKAAENIQELIGENEFIITMLPNSPPRS